MPNDGQLLIHIAMYDVAVIGGGPAGSTAGSLLKKYSPELSVLILERETFPRDHVGESQLPPIAGVLEEMGCWDKVEAANFPIKIGATYRWGKTPELWDFEFFPAKLFKDEPRPAKLAGQRRSTAFQVDRSVYDKILLDHAAELGCEVRQQTKVVKIASTGDRVEGLELESGERIDARYYLDASGHTGVLRRAMGVPVEVPTSLQNIAIWDYWQNADWAVEIGVGGTRVQVMSLGYGWIWFIPLGPTRTSVGLVIPVQYYKNSKTRPDELYRKALAEEPRIAALMQNAVSEGKLQTTNDWSFLSKRQGGENWLLAGESCGFADPILAAGMSLTHASAREAAYSFLEAIRGKEPWTWLLAEYEKRQIDRIQSHIRFADYWYTANSQFEDLKEFTAQIAADNGLDLTPDKAWAWLGQGGFIDSDANLGTAGFPVAHIKTLGTFLADVEPEPILDKYNVFQLDISGAEWRDQAWYKNGSVKRIGSYVRGKRILPLIGAIELVVDILQRTPRIHQIRETIQILAKRHENDPKFLVDFIGRIPPALEAMVTDGWVKPSYDPNQPTATLPRRMGEVIHWNEDAPKSPP